MSTTLMQANREYCSRPKDERFPSVAAMIDNARTQKDHSVEVTYNAKDLRAVVHGENVALRNPKGTIANFTHWSFGQICRAVGAPASYLRDLPAGIAVDCLNDGLSKTGHGTDLQLLVQRPNGKPEPTVRAATTDSYGRVWDADLYGQTASMILDRDARWQLPPTWSGDPAGAYRGDRDSFLIVTNGGSIVTDPSAGSKGEMYRGLMIRNSEVGAAAVSIEQILYRYICGNHMIWGAVIDKSYRRRHLGKQALRDTLRMIMTVAHEWANRSASKDEAIIKALIDHEIAATRDGVIDELRKIGFTREHANAAYDRCANTEEVSPRSFWGIAQGTTRLSQDSGYQSDRLELDALAAIVMRRGAMVTA
jgi:hypothetical protein